MKLSDYKGEEAIILWGKLLTPISEIAKDPNIKGKKRMEAIQYVIQNHTKEVLNIVQTVDNEEVNGLTLPLRFIEIANEILQSPSMSSFFQ